MQLQRRRAEGRCASWPPHWQRLLLGLLAVQAVLQERRGFGAVGLAEQRQLGLH